VVELDPELGQNTLRSVAAADDETAICAFLDEEEGCVLESFERPSICHEFKCDLYQVAERDPRMIAYCLNHTIATVDDLWDSQTWTMYCEADCPYQNLCQMPTRRPIEEAPKEAED
jgi:hypothetical protein